MLGRWLVVLAMGIVACASSAEGDPSQALLGEVPVRVVSDGGVSMEVVSKGPVQLGKNELEVTFPSAPATVLVGVASLMPAHGHGGPVPKVERVGEAYLVHDVVLYMSGRWELRFSLRSTAGSDDEAKIDVDVP